jgi:Carboxypeptidase regulatory-like domain
MVKMVFASLVVLSVLAPIPAAAQTDMGGLRGYVKDEQGGALPGVTVTATGPQILAPVVAVTDDGGYYRLLNLPPGTITLTVELAGFAPYRREGIVMRAGSTFEVNVEMKVGALQENITVAGESPMIETLKASTSYAISGELMRAAPVTARAVFTDTLDMIPGIGSGQANDGSGVRIYYFMGSTQWSGYTALEGANFGSFGNMAPARTSMSPETIGDVEIRTGGADASTPLTTGIYMNIVSPRGGKDYRGSAAFDIQPLSWNADNSSGGRVSGGVPKPEEVRHVDLSFGGPLVQNRAWFFSTFRWMDDVNGISRTPLNLNQLKAFRPNFAPFNNTFRTKDPFVKVTTQLNSSHELSALYHFDRMAYTSHREFDEDPITFQGGGGSMVQARLNSLWGPHLISQLSFAYNNKTQASNDTYGDLQGSGPQQIIHNDIFISGGLPVGTGQLVRQNNTQTTPITGASILVMQGDMTYFKEGWGGSHELKTGIFAAPRSRRDTLQRYQNDGFILQEVRQVDPANTAAGVTPFHMQYITPTQLPTIAARDKDIGFYVQDSWKPTPRLTANVGLRVDLVRRFDAILGIQRMSSTEVGPRLGLSYLVTKDAKNVVRFSAGRYAEQVSGNDVVESFATITPVTTRDVYIDKAGAQTTIITAPPTAALAVRQLAKDLHQPFVDEYILGFRKQFPGQLSLDVSGVRRYYKDEYGLVDINGIYPSGPFQPFGGFGLVDPTRGILYQERNNTWSQEVVTGLMVVVAKNLSHNMQAMVAYNRQWQHLAGTWNPTDPARFVQPDAFPNNRELPWSGGNRDENTLDGRGGPQDYMWRPYNFRLTGQYLAPWQINIAGSYQWEGSDYSGPIVTRIAAPDPRIGPARVTLANGTTQANPLATTIRFAFPTRGDGQVLNEPIRTAQLKIGRKFKLGRHQFEPSVNIYNLFNSGANIQYAVGNNQLYNPNYLGQFNKLPARGVQLTFVDRF